MKEKAFTLIEVMVVMAIISILAGMMAPAVWKYWETEEVSATRQKLENLKIAMVGDRTLIQNGVRTHFGFFGDNGELPFGNISTHGGLKFLQENYNSVYPKWAGPYLPNSSDRSSYMLDAWGNKIEYVPVQIPPGDPNRYVTAELRSYGPDGIPNTNDDIVVTIEERESTASTDKVRGKLLVYATHTSAISATVDISYRDATVGDGSGVRSSTPHLACLSYQVTAASSAYYSYSSSHFQKLPVGKVDYKTHIYNNSTCSGTAEQSLSSFYFVHEDTKDILVNFPSLQLP